MLKLIKLAKMAGVMHEADHTYSIRSTWSLHQLATNVPFKAYVINLSCTFTHYLELSNFQFYDLDCRILEFLTICLLLVYFVSAAGCHCFDFFQLLKEFLKDSCTISFSAIQILY